jgi:hypothetical protein
MEVNAAFALIDEHCQAERMKIVGYYHANANHQHRQPSVVARRIADKVYDVMKEEERCEHSLPPSLPLSLSLSLSLSLTHTHTHTTHYLSSSRALSHSH